MDAPPPRMPGRLPKRKVTMNQLVGYNLAAYRNAAGLTQEELGKRLGGWTKVAVSAAERSWDGRRVRKFDADELVLLARVLGVPVVALFLPPEDAGTAVRYVLDAPGLPDLVALLPDFGPADAGDSACMKEFQTRLMALGVHAGGAEAGYPQQPVQVLVEGESEAALMALLQQELAEREEVKDALGLADLIISRARDRAEWLERDAQARYQQAMESLTRQREELERRVDDLRAFEREYRSRLSAYVEGQLRDLRAGADVDGAFPAMGSSSSRDTGSQ